MNEVWWVLGMLLAIGGAIYGIGLWQRRGVAEPKPKPEPKGRVARHRRRGGFHIPRWSKNADADAAQILAGFEESEGETWGPFDYDDPDDYTEPPDIEVTSDTAEPDPYADALTNGPDWRVMAKAYSKAIYAVANRGRVR